MKGKSSILSAVLILTLGVVLVIINRSLRPEGIVICGGVMFLVAAVLNIFFFMGEDAADNGKRRNGGALTRIFGWLSSIAGLILGLCMLVFESSFTPLIPYIFGGVLILAAAFHFYVLSLSYRPIVFPGWTYVIPVLILVAGVWVFFMDGNTSSSLMMILTGSGLCVFSVGVIIESVFIHSYNKQLRKGVVAGQPAAHDTKVEDVDATDAAAQPEKNKLRTLDEADK